MKKKMLPLLLLGLAACERSAQQHVDHRTPTPATQQLVESTSIPTPRDAPARGAAAGPSLPPAPHGDSLMPSPDLKLSSAMRRVLDDSVPGFVPWTMEHYVDEVRQWYRQTRQQPPWAVF